MLCVYVTNTPDILDGYLYFFPPFYYAGVMLTEMYIMLPHLW